MKFKAILAAFAALSCLGVQAETYNGMTYSKGEVEPGVWNASYQKAKAYAEENGNPLIVFWGNSGCGHCRNSEQSIGADEELASWLKENEIVLSLSIGGNSNFSSSDSSAAKKFAGPTGSYPFVRYYWVDENGVEHNKKTQSDTTGAKMLANAKAIFKGWSPSLKEAGAFPASSEYSRLEAEEGTETVDFTMTREEKYAVATNLVLKALVGGKEMSSTPLVWTAGQLSQDVSVDVSSVTGLKDGEVIDLQVFDANGGTKPLAKTKVTWVAKENAAANPLWIGERKNPYANGIAPDFEFGEWTMDYELATQVVAKTEGAFTLVSIQGSQWCPDCANTDRNFLDLEYEGVNRFKAWAAENKVALVTLDIPNFTDAAGSFSSPTLLSRTAYESTLARNKYVDKDGNPITNFKERDIGKKVFPQETPELTAADPALTEPAKRSGLGYLTRKGVSDAEAEKVLSRNHALVTKYTAEGGFHRPYFAPKDPRNEDGNGNRTGVPIFVLLRQDGTVAGRFTQFASVSPFKADRENFEAYVERIEELMLVAAGEDGEIENNHSSTTAESVEAMDGRIAGSVSHADAVDVCRLANVQTGALQKVSLMAAAGLATGPITLELRKGDAVLASTNGTLASGMSVEALVDDAAADYFAAIKPDLTDAAFAAASAETTVRDYLMSTAVVLVPTTTAQTFKPTSETIALRVEMGKIYKLNGIDGPVRDELVNVTNDFYQAWVSGDVTVSDTNRAAIVYQRWETGGVGFDGEGMAVSETAGKVEIPVVRRGGSSGKVSVDVKLDLERSVCRDAEGNPGYDTNSYKNATFTWEEGKGQTFKLPITLKNGVDYGADGGKYVFTLKIVEGMAELSSTEFVLSVSKSVVSGPGTVGFAGASKVVVRESEGYVVTVERRTASDGEVSAQLKTSAGVLETNLVSWGNHELTAREVKLTGVPAGKTAKVSFGKFTGGLKADKTGKTVSVTAVADDAPAFSQTEYAETGYRNVKFSKSFPVISMASAANKLTTKKISGSLPSGLKIAWEGTAALVVSGVPTKAGEYEAVYQVIETRGKKKVDGLTAKIAITVVDPTAVDPAHPELPPINASCLVKRDFTDVMVIDTCKGRLLGTLTFQIPKGSTGKISGKYVSAAGTVTFKAPKSWSRMEDSTLVSEIEGNRTGYKLTVKALADGLVVAMLDDPTVGCTLKMELGDEPWSEDDSAEDWKGYYTVALSNETTNAGCGIMTLKMESASDLKKGQMGWTLVLPNGKSFSGKSVLTRGDGEFVYLPVFVSKKDDTFSAVVRVLANAKAQKDEWRASVLLPDESDGKNFCGAYWTNGSGESATEVGFGVYGGIYDVDEDLDACCIEFYKKADMHFFADGEALAAITVGPDAIKIPKGSDNPQKVSLSFSRKTGVLSGTFVVPGTTKASWKGVVLIGWGAGCGCDDPKTPVYLPFVNGAYHVGGVAVGRVEVCPQEPSDGEVK